AVRRGADRLLGDGVQAQSDAGGADQRARAARDHAVAGPGGDGRRAVARADARRLGEQAGRGPRGVPLHGRLPDAVPQRGRGARGARAGDPPPPAGRAAVHGDGGDHDAGRQGRRGPPGPARAHPSALGGRGEPDEGRGRGERPGGSDRERPGVPPYAAGDRRGPGPGPAHRTCARAGGCVPGRGRRAGAGAVRRGARGAGAEGMTSTVTETRLPFPLVARGKVRDVYDVGSDRLLMVATDRISAFDVVLPQPIPHKGEVLTLITAWWLTRLEDITPNHLISVDPAVIAREVPALAGLESTWARRAMLVRRTEPFPVECVVRGYLAGSAWAEYRRTGTLAGEPLPPGLVESARLDPPIFSPATKATEGHDENITFDEMCRRIGAETAELLRERSLAIYERGRE